ncbi:unnamed protein product [Cyclocybe aegerita]|uniref:Uncharacterized protein n=1 Tax=Cyclocybe aegerita TaxID=1973307 RepID=A0A8S0X9E1_CYCAE|nr:unnamed protein product [Cyclocybe aegerita]
MDDMDDPRIAAMLLKNSAANGSGNGNGNGNPFAHNLPPPPNPPPMHGRYEHPSYYNNGGGGNGNGQQGPGFGGNGGSGQGGGNGQGGNGMFTPPATSHGLPNANGNGSMNGVSTASNASSAGSPVGGVSVNSGGGGSPPASGPGGPLTLNTTSLNILAAHTGASSHMSAGGGSAHGSPGRRERSGSGSGSVGSVGGGSVGGGGSPAYELHHGHGPHGHGGHGGMHGGHGEYASVPRRSGGMGEGYMIMNGLNGMNGMGGMGGMGMAGGMGMGNMNGGMGGMNGMGMGGMMGAHGHHHVGLGGNGGHHGQGQEHRLLLSVSVNGQTFFQIRIVAVVIVSRFFKLQVVDQPPRLSPVSFFVFVVVFKPSPAQPSSTLCPSSLHFSSLTSPIVSSRLQVPVLYHPYLKLKLKLKNPHRHHAPSVSSAECRPHSTPPPTSVAEVVVYRVPSTVAYHCSYLLPTNLRMLSVVVIALSLAYRWDLLPRLRLRIAVVARVHRHSSSHAFLTSTPPHTDTTPRSHFTPFTPYRTTPIRQPPTFSLPPHLLPPSLAHPIPIYDTPRRARRLPTDPRPKTTAVSYHLSSSSSDLVHLFGHTRTLGRSHSFTIPSPASPT